MEGAHYLAPLEAIPPEVSTWYSEGRGETDEVIKYLAPAEAAGSPCALLPFLSGGSSDGVEETSQTWMQTPTHLLHLHAAPAFPARLPSGSSLCCSALCCHGGGPEEENRTEKSRTRLSGNGGVGGQGRND